MQRHWSHKKGLVGALLATGLLCALPATGQVIEEGYPTKPVFPEEPPAAPHLHEECGPFLDSAEFAEECAGDNGPDAVGIGSDGEGSSGSFLDPPRYTPPRLECPSAVFLEELETGAIDCHASDAAGTEHLDYRWEPIGGASRDYLENPRLIPEDAPNPMVVAPSSPQYEALETFLSEEGTQRYRYRLTATSRATGLSSWSEVEVFVLWSRPEVYCPLEVSVEEGATVALACEGADPLSFRMDDGPGDAPVLWEWEGLWGASTAPLTAADTPQPLFTAPPGSAGATYHYVANMTTHSSGVARTARRRVSVTVKAAEDRSAPSITCPDSPYEIYEGHGELTLACEAQNAPAGATYLWGDSGNSLTDTDTLVTTFKVPDDIGNYVSIFYQFPIHMLDVDGNVVAYGWAYVTVNERPNIRMCVIGSSRDIDEGSAPIILNPCVHEPTGAPGDTLDTPYPYRYQWATRSPTPSSALSLLSASDVYHPVFTPPADVSRQTVYHYTLTVSADNANDFVFPQDITVNDLNAGVFSLECASTSFSAYDNVPDITLACAAPAAPPDAVWLWTPRDPTKDTDRLSATDIRNPVFDVQEIYNLNTNHEWFYYNVSVSAGSQSQSQDIVVKVNSRYITTISCGYQATFLEGDEDRTIGNCRFYRGSSEVNPNNYRPTWRGVSTTDTRFATINDFVTATLSNTTSHAPTFYVPDRVDRHEQYVYILRLDRRMDALERRVIVRVLDRESFDAELALDCEDVEVYETGATEDITLSCIAKNVPSGRTPKYEWEARDLLDLARLINGRTTSSPTFRAPAEVDEDKTYVYKATVKAENTLSGSDIVTVTVKEKPDIVVTCPGNPYSPYEGSGEIALNCSASGAPGPSPDYTYTWTARGSTADTDRLSATDVASPTFAVPDQANANETYEYTLTVSADNAEDGEANVTVTVLDKPQIAVTCTNPDPVYEGSPDITLDCKATGAPGSAPDYAYVWTTRGATSDTNLLTGTDGPTPTFAVPDQVNANETYEYTLTVSADNAEDGTADVTVTVLDKPAIVVTCTNPGPVYEGSPDITLDCSQPTGAPAGSAYDYAWMARSPTPDTALLTANADGPRPTFAVPDNVDADTKYEYTLTVSADNAEVGTAEVTVTVLDKPQIVVTCTDPDPVYEGSVDRIQLDCSQPTGAPAGSAYDYAWSARSPTPDTKLLTGTDGPTPTFAVPEDVPQSTKYEYTLAVSAENADAGMAEVTVTVLNEGAIALACPDPDPVYEGAPDLALTCTVTGAPGANPAYSYVWTVRGDTPDTGLLSAADVASPTFMTPNNVDSDETYEYAVTVSAPSAEPATDNVTVTVLDKPAIVVACAGNPYSAYEDSGDIVLGCLATGAPGDNPSYSYAWSARGDTPDTGLLRAADVASPTFATPAEVSQTTTYEYLLTVMAANAETAIVAVTVTVLNTGALALACANPDPIYEGSADIALDCAASGAPEGSSYSYVWSARGATTDTGRLVAGADGPTPTFQTPDRVNRDETYEYTLTVSAENAEDAAAEVTVTVLNNLPLALACANPDPVYEGSVDIRLDCTASGAPAGSPYEYAWTPRGSTADTGLLSATDMASPSFSVPADVPQTTRYEYAVMVTALGADAAMSEVTVTVLNTGAIALVCRGHPYSAYEGSGDLALNCSASGAPEGSDYDYVWTARGATADTDRLVAGADGPTPTFAVPDNVSMDERYDYLLTVTAEAAEAATAEVTVTVLNKRALALSCANPDPVYEGSPDLTLDCAASGAPAGSDYEYVWRARGATADTDLLSAADMASPVFAVPDDIPQTTRYEYLLTVSAEHADPATAEVTVTVLNKGALALVCPGNPYSAYEGSEDITLNCSASGAPDGSDYEYAWTARGATADTDLLSAADIASPTFAVPDNVDQNETYAYLLTVSAERAEAATAEITVTVLDKGALALVCPGNPYSAYEGSEDITLNCSASGAPDGSDYEYAWTPRGATADTDLLSATDVASPTFAVPDAVDTDETYEYLLAVFARNAEAAGVEVTVTVLDRIEEAPAPDPVALSVDPSALGIRVGVSRLRFGVQSSDTQVSLDALTDRISTSVSGPHHAGRLTLSSDGDLSLDENGEVALSIELVTPVTLRREGSGDAPPLSLAPTWSMAASCEQLASQSIGGLHTETRLSESDCRLLLFGGELDLTDAPPGRYSGNLNVILRTASGEETHSIAAEVEVISGDRVILAGAGGVRFGSSREVPMGLLEEQTVSIYPNLAYLTRGEPSGVFELSNRSLIPLEVSVSARFGYTEATEDGFDAVVEDRDSARLGDLSEALEIHPQTLILKPGERGVVRYGVREEALAEMTGGYAAFFEIASFPRQYARTDWLPEAVSGGKTALVTMRVPGAYAPSEDASHIRAELFSAAGASPSATFLIETGGVPFAGEAVAYDADGRELGRRRTLVYTRSRVRIPFTRIPEGEAVFLRFVPSGSGEASEPVSIPWTAPPRSEGDIGAAVPLKN